LILFVNDVESGSWEHGSCQGTNYPRCAWYTLEKGQNVLEILKVTLWSMGHAEEENI